MSSFALRGVIAAIPTPVAVDGEPNLPRFIDLARFLLESGCDGLNVLGTTGEATSLTVAQRKRIMSAVADAGLPLKAIIVGTGAAAVGDAADLTRHASNIGFAGALVLPPFYYKGVGRRGIMRYFDAIASASGELPLLLYNFPAMTGILYSVELVESLIEEFGPRIAGLKDSSGDLVYSRAIAELSGKLAVFPSNEKVLIEARKSVFAGCISATANVNADLCAAAYHSGSDVALAAAIAIRGLFDGKPLVPGVKALMARLR